MYSFSNSTIYTLLPILFRENSAYSRVVSLPFNGKMLGILDLLIRNKRVLGYKVVECAGIYRLSISLCYVDNKPRLMCCQFVSKPGRRIYVSVNYLRRKMMRLANSLFVVSSTYGLLSGVEAVILNTGGELICILH